MHSLSQAALVSKKDLFSYAKDALQVVAGSLFLSLCAQIAIPLFPVPLTMQTFAVMLLGATLGKVKGTLSVLAYIAESMLGFPVLAGMIVEPLAIFGLRGGYLFGFIAQAYLTGTFFEKYKTPSFSFTLFSLLLISLLQLGMGALWLASFIGLNQALLLGFYPFVPGTVLKCLAFFPAYSAHKKI
ncbi:MAG TPA: biotin transporter BioY [Parachlamydiaceae bacterium]|nr:biotin transporter BioY [Parachlamydiaceae bacterium]